MRAIKFEAAQTHFLSDVFLAVAVAVAYKLPSNSKKEGANKVK